MIDVVKLHQFRPFLGRHDGKSATNIPYIFPVQKFKNSSRSLFHLSSIKKKEVIEKKKLLAPRFIFKYRKGISPREKVSLSCRGNRRIIRGKTEKKSRVPWQLFPPPTPFFLFFLSPHYFRYSYSNNLRSSYLSNGVIQHTRVYNGERLIKSNGCCRRAWGGEGRGVVLARWNSRFSNNGVESVMLFAPSPLIIPQIRNFLPRTGSSFLPSNCSPDPGVVPEPPPR